MNMVIPAMRYFAVFCLLFALFGFSFADDRGAPLQRKATFGAQFAPNENMKGLKIVRVLPKLSAESSGIKENDIILKADGKALAQTSDFVAIMSKKYAGDKIQIELQSGEKKLTKDIVLLGRPKQQSTESMVVEYDQVVSQGKRIRMILTHPAKKGKVPVIFLIGGIGAYSSDGEFSTIPYGNFLARFQEEGWATVRIDKPGQGDSEGPIYSSLTFNSELDAYRQALKSLSRYDYLDLDRVFIFGHSMGGAFGPILGRENRFAGVIVSSTFVKSWAEYFMESLRFQLGLGGTPESEISEIIRQASAFQHYMFYEGLTVSQMLKKDPSLKQIVTILSPDQLTYSGVGFPFFKELSQHDLAADWAKVDSKVLVLCGENDFIATVGDHPIIERIVNQAHPGNAKYVSLPKSDHGFFLTESFTDSRNKWGRPGNTFNPVVLETITGWVKDILKSKS